MRLLLVPSVIVTKSLAEATSKLPDVCKMYKNDLLSPSNLQKEIHTWHLKWAQEKK